MIKVDEVIERMKGIHAVALDKTELYINNMSMKELNTLINDAVAVMTLLKAPLPDQDKADLDVIHRIRSGSLKKSVCRDYAIYNGDWYRSHPWFTPEGGKLLRAFVMDMESSNSIINTVNIHNMSFDDASRILMLCGPACDLLSPKGFIRWLKEKMMGDPRIREEVMRNA